MKKRVIVVGGGIVGLCSAYYAARRGFDVTVVDAAGPERAGCSHGNAGLVVPSHFVPLASPGALGSGLKWLFDSESPFYIKPRFDFELMGWLWRFYRSATHAHVERSAAILRDLNLQSRACYEALASENPDFGLARDGLLMVCLTEHTMKEEADIAARADELGLEVEVLDGPAARAREPSLSPDIAGAVLYPQDCRLNPGRLMAGLRDRLKASGVRVLWNQSVTGWQLQKGYVARVETSEGPIDADAFVVAGGSWSAKLARQLKVNLPLQPGRGYSLTLNDPPARLKTAALCVEARIAVTPMSEALRFAGTMELAGLELKVNPSRVRGLTKNVPRYLPDFGPDDFASVEPWSGLRPCSPDGLPYIGSLPSLKNVVVATGHSMMGLSLGPVTGKLVGEILDDENPSLALDALRPDRFA